MLLLVADMMAGVGPFAVPLGRNRGARVFANDLNPDSHAALVANIAANKVGQRVTPFNLCGRYVLQRSQGASCWGVFLCISGMGLWNCGTGRSCAS